MIAGYIYKGKFYKPEHPEFEKIQKLVYEKQNT